MSSIYQRLTLVTNYVNHNRNEGGCFVRVLSLVLTALLSSPVAIASAAPVETVQTGTIAGSRYRIETPAKWNGSLVILLHGYEPRGVPRPEPLPANEMTHAFLKLGYAVAEPGYSAQGWAVSEALDDIDRLRSHYLSTGRRPARIYLAGFSLGGHLALAALERSPKVYAGALSLCGVNMPGSDVGAAMLRNLVAFDRYFPAVLPDVAQGLADPASPPMIDPSAIEAALARDEAKAKLLSTGLDIRRPDLAGAIMLSYMILQEIRNRADGFPVSNVDTQYTGFDDDPAFNREVRRYAGDAAAMRYLNDRAPLNGNIGSPVIIQSNDNDPTIPALYGDIYNRLVSSRGRSNFLTELSRVGDGHCDFTEQQVIDAMRMLAEKKPYKIR